MIEKIRQILARSWHHYAASATEYSTVEFTDSVYRPTRPFKGLQVGTAGDIEIEDLRGKVVVLSAVTAGTHPFAGKAIHETSTTAAGITALF